MTTPRLNKLLARVGILTRLAETFAASCRALAVLLTAMLLAVAIDVAVSLQPWALILLDCALLGLALTGLIYIGWIVYRNRYNARRLARLIENRLEVSDNSLINAVDLAEESLKTASRELCNQALLRGESQARSIVPAKLVNSRRLKPAVLAAGIAVLVTISALLGVRGVFRAVIPRFLQPMAENPPFTLLNFDVRIAPEKVYHSNPAVITTVLSGMSSLPDQANAVFLNPDDRWRQSLPMLRSPSGEFVLRIDRAERSRQFYIDTPAGRSKRYKLTVHPVPTFQRVHLRYDYPAYTHWPRSSSVLAEDNSLRAIEGTKITITVTSNLPLGGGKMVLAGLEKDAEHSEVQLRLTEDPLKVRGSFEISSSGQYAITLRSAEGVPGDRSLQGIISCVPDAPPQVEFLEPDQIVASPTHWKVPVEVAARDDVAVGRIVLFRGINGWGSNPVDLQKKTSGPTYASSNYLFDLPVLGARPGDVITYYASAYDSHPSGEHFSDTDTYVIRVVDEQEYLEYARASYRIDDLMEELSKFRDQIETLAKQREELLKKAQELAEKLARSQEQLSQSEMDSLRQFAQDQREYARNAEALAEQIRQRLDKPQLYEFEGPYKDMLAEMTENLQGQSNRTKHLTDSFAQMEQGGLGRAPSGDYLRKSIEELRKPEKAAGDFEEKAELTEWQLRQLSRADDLVSLVQSVAAIVEQQRQLAERMGQFRNKELLSPAEQIRARRMSQEQVELRDQLEGLLEEMDNQSQEAQMLLPKMSSSVADLVEQIRQLNVLRDQTDAAVLSQAGRGRYAWRAADDAANKLESLVRQCQNPGGQVSEDIDSPLGLTAEQISLSLDQLAQSRGLPGTGTGNSGSGYYGSRTNINLLGPHASKGKGQTEADMQGTGDGTGSQRKGSGQNGQDPESIVPGQAAGRGQNVPSMPGVPIRFRSLVEEYFRRLADESK